MAKNITALKNLYKQLGGDPEDVQDCSTITEVLNAISGKYDGETDAATNPDAIDNIAAVAENIGYPEPVGTKTITENGTYDVKDYASAEVSVASASVETDTVTFVNNTTKPIYIQNGPFIADGYQGSIYIAKNSSATGEVIKNISGTNVSNTNTFVVFVNLMGQSVSWTATATGDGAIVELYPDQYNTSNKCMSVSMLGGTRTVTISPA